MCVCTFFTVSSENTLAPLAATPPLAIAVPIRAIPRAEQLELQNELTLTMAQ